MIDVIRQVLVELGTPARWDLTRLGAGLSLSGPDADGGHTVTRSGGAGTTSTISKLPVRGSWVCAVEIKTLMTGTVTVGVRKVPQRRQLVTSRVVNSSRDQDSAAGGKDNTYALRSDGTKCSGGVTASTGVTFAAGDRFVMRFDEYTSTLTISKNADAVAATWVNLQGPWELMATCGGAGSALRLVSDVDDVPWTRRFRPAGIWGRIALTGWTTPHTDLVCRNTYFDGRIDPESEPSFAISPQIPLLDGGSPERPVGDFQVLNADRGVDQWLDWSTRDELITIRKGALTSTYAQFVVAGTGRIEELASSGDETRIRITPRDPVVVFDAAWQAETYPTAGVVASLAGKSKETTSGECRYVPMALRNATMLIYGIGDDALQSIGVVRDQGVALTEGTGYSLPGDRTTIQRLTNPAGLQCVDTVHGTVADIAAIVDATVGDFKTWSGSPSAPTGWVNEATAPATITAGAAGGVRLRQISAGSAYAVLRHAAPLPTEAMLVRLDITVSAASAGQVVVRLTNWVDISVEIQIPAVVGTHTFYVTKGAGATTMFAYTPYVVTDITISKFRMAQVAPLDDLPAWIRHLATERGPLSINDVDMARVAAVASVRPWPLCLHTPAGSDIRILDVLDQTVRSIGGGWYVTPTGQLSLLSLILPKGESAALTDIEIIGGIHRALCVPRGLSDRVAGVPNWCLHSDSDIAGSMLTTAANRAIAEALKSQYLVVRRGSAQLASVYESAIGAEPIQTLLSSDAGVTGLADAVTTYFSVPRWIYTLTAKVSDELPDLIGQAVLVTSSCYDLDAGKRLLVVGGTGRYSSDVIELKLLG